jgi:hypothetical protein
MAGRHRAEKRSILDHSLAKDNEVRIIFFFHIFVMNSLRSATNSTLPAITLHLNSSYSFTKLPIIITFCSAVLNDILSTSAVRHDLTQAGPSTKEQIVVQKKVYYS